jgi:circadian clock protein KaiB
VSAPRRRPDQGDGPVAPDPLYHLVLYVSGMGPRSAAAIPAVRALCEQYLPGRYALDVIDLDTHDWSSAEADQVLAAPTLVRRRPPPLRRVVGDLADTRRVMAALQLAREDE